MSAKTTPNVICPPTFVHLELHIALACAQVPHKELGRRRKWDTATTSENHTLYSPSLFRSSRAGNSNMAGKRTCV